MTHEAKLFGKQCEIIKLETVKEGGSYWSNNITSDSLETSHMLSKTNPNSFQTNLTSLEGLAKYIDPSQLTADLEGTLAYDHTIWIEMRCVSTSKYL